MSGLLPLNNNSFEDDATLATSLYSNEGVIDGLEFYASATPNNQITLKYSFNEDTKDGQGTYGSLVLRRNGNFHVFSIQSTNLPGGVATFSFGNGATAPDDLYALIIASVDFAQADTKVMLSVVTGSVPSQDPTAGIADSGTYRSIILARIKLQGSPSVITQDDIIYSGISTQSSNTNELLQIKTIRPKVKFVVNNLDIYTTADRPYLNLNDATLFVERNTDNDGTLKIYDQPQNKDIPIKYANENIWEMTSALNLGTYNTTSSTTGSGINTVYVKINRVSPTTPFENVFNDIAGTGDFVIPANSLKMGDKIVIRGELESSFTAYSSGGSPSSAYQFIIFVNNRTVSSNNINPISIRYTNGVSTTLNRLPATNIVFISASQSGSLGVNLKHQFRLEGTILKTGVSGKIRFIEFGDFYSIGGLTTPIFNEKNIGRTIICETATINTTITNTLIFDFDVIRAGSGATTFVPTITLNTFQITKE